MDEQRINFLIEQGLTELTDKVLTLENRVEELENDVWFRRAERVR